jgi:hypothetical protein
MPTTKSSKRPPKEPDRARSAPRQEQSPPEAPTLGVAYLNLFGPPALAESTDTHLTTYAAVRAILEHESAPHARTAAKAARDAAEQHASKALATSGGQER